MKALDRFHLGKGSGNEGELLQVEFTNCQTGALGVTVQQVKVTERLSKVNANRFNALYESCKEKLYESWKRNSNGEPFDKWLSKQWDESKNRFRL
jgi:hypothetical protein